MDCRGQQQQRGGRGASRRTHSEQPQWRGGQQQHRGRGNKSGYYNDRESSTQDVTSSVSGGRWGNYQERSGGGDPERSRGQRGGRGRGSAGAEGGDTRAASGGRWGNYQERSGGGDPERSRGQRGGRGRGRGRAGAEGGDTRAARNYPIGYKRLQELLSEPADQLVLRLNSERSGVNELLADPTILPDKMFLFIKVLAKAVSSQSSSQGVLNILTMVFQSTFIDRLVKFQITLLQLGDVDLKGFLGDQLKVFQCYCRSLPFDASDNITELVQSTQLVLPPLALRFDGLKELTPKYDSLIQSLGKYSGYNGERGQREKISREERIKLLDSREPGDDFRRLPVEPMPEDVTLRTRPVLRRNITDSGYKDVDTYLDVQFRLLREDFIRPLREGICDYKAKENSRNSGVRVYRRARFQGSEINRGKLVYWLNVNVPKNVKLETSKRLMFGNLLCVTRDDFLTFSLATVSEKEETKLRKGIVGISFFEKPNINLNFVYTVVESRTFFASYKHVLLAIQRLHADNLPLIEHIVHVQRRVNPPMYLVPEVENPYPVRQRRYYDLRVVMDPTQMKQTPANLLFPESTSRPPIDGDHEPLRRLPITNGIEWWPGCQQFNLDQSQLNALHAALTRRLVVIQGPPGTGKTFLGLKITQVLLHNSEAWSNGRDDAQQAGGDDADNDQCPILVVCYTNHALDQFLEGMLKFTKKVVRIGGRSKSEEIQQYQINKMVSQLRQARKLPASIHHANLEIENQLRTAESSYRSAQGRLEKINTTEGLIKWSRFTQFGVIPATVLQQIRDNQDFRDWIISSSEDSNNAYQPAEVWENAHLAAHQPKMQEQEVEVNEDEFHDALELLREEERDRLDDDYDEYHSGFAPEAVSSENDFEVLINDQEKILYRLEMDVQLAGTKEYFTRKQRIENERTNLVRLLTFANRDVHTLKLRPNINIRLLTFKDKCLLYTKWKNELKAALQAKLDPFEEQFRQYSAAVDEIKRSRYLHVARQADVVGMTTTGAAEYQKMVQDLKPKIVIIEEAAEILEAHVITTLSASCQHLIMIGDHQQLRPSTAVYDLAKHYGLETSMFERMINNGLEYQTLQYQHRMRPDISRLLVPTIYEDLLDHQSVTSRPSIKGLASNVFFVTHHEMELAESDDNNSHSNVHEASFTMQLARHLVLQGYSTDQITVLTPYSGQFFLLKQEQRKFSNTCHGIRISIVDNFQGEENDIILLSLVRSNDKGQVGFLKIENRVCVALSRARNGLYIIGNLDQLCESAVLWQKIREGLEENDNVGNYLGLKCQNHPEQVSKVKSAQELKFISPEGGCRLPCSDTFPGCGHSCPRMCHTDDPSHSEANCNRNCDKSCTKKGHPCRAVCWQPCPPCKVMVPKRLSCDHTHDIMCHVSRTTFQCPSLIEKVIPRCEHKVQMPCHQDPVKYKCPVQCEVRLDCGHACRNKCHVTADPDHKKYLCEAPCQSVNSKCSTKEHNCRRKCYEKCIECNVKIEKKAPCGHKVLTSCSDDFKSYQCKKACRKVIQACGHHCPNKCYQPCGDCKVKVEKKIPECGHTVKMACGSTPSRADCTNQTCPRPLPCGHPCTQPCSKPCTTKCMARVSTQHYCAKKHRVYAPCHLQDSLSDHDAGEQCAEPCRMLLDCNHPCSGTCGDCLHGRLHQPCGQKCQRTLVCGHLCKAPCSNNCPPCQEKCRWRCTHSYCNKICGLKCEPCKMPCKPMCAHVKECGMKCGEVCQCKPCELPCPKTLIKCGHPCVGLCGDPCPPLCRICDNDTLTEILFGDEDEPDARFVYLEECQHVVEYEGLKSWLQSNREPEAGESIKVQMKTCPKGCQQPLYNNQRFKNIILETYQDVQQVLFKYGEQTPTLQAITDKLITAKDELEADKAPCVRPELLFLACIETSELVRAVKACIETTWPDRQQSGQAHFGRRADVKKRMPKLSSEKLHLFDFQAEVIRQAHAIRKDLKRNSFKQNLDDIVKRVMLQVVSVSDQFCTEVTCEVQRVAVSELVAGLQQRLHHSPQAAALYKQMQLLLDPGQVFTTKKEDLVNKLLDQCAHFYSRDGISIQERMEIKEALKFSGSGHWYKCPNGHVYAIGNCGLANEASVCPVRGCKAGIGGTQYRLHPSNSIAHEMEHLHI